jgi:hypothetical protein
MKRCMRHKRCWLVGYLLLILALSACSLDGGGNGSSTATPSSGHGHTTSQASGIQLGLRPCPAAVQSDAHWETIVATSASHKVEGVLFPYLMGVPSLTAMMNTRFIPRPSILPKDDFVQPTTPMWMLFLDLLP